MIILIEISWNYENLFEIKKIKIQILNKLKEEFQKIFDLLLKKKKEIKEEIEKLFLDEEFEGFKIKYTVFPKK